MTEERKRRLAKDHIPASCPHEASLSRMVADLHTHTCLSPCGSLDMTPQTIVAEACRKKIDILAITDHNSAENVAAVMEVAKTNQSPVLIVPGMEITTEEEVHLLGLFPSLQHALEVQKIVFACLMKGKNNEVVFGLQVVANAHDEVEGINQRLLVAATSLSVTEVVQIIHDAGGLAIASHIDRPCFSIISQLGFIDPQLPLEALEISRDLSPPQARRRFPSCAGRAFITSSDAHDPAYIGLKPTTFLLDAKLARAGHVLSEIKYALAGRKGRRIVEGP